MKNREKTSWSFRSFKTNKNQELEPIEGIFPKDIINNEIESELNEIKKLEEKIKRKDLIYRANK